MRHRYHTAAELTASWTVPSAHGRVRQIRSLSRDRRVWVLFHFPNDDVAALIRRDAVSR
jgi:hypothetical protein